VIVCVKGTVQYTHLTAPFPGQPGKPVAEKQNHDNEARDDGVAVASAGLYANHLHFAPDRQPHQYPITQFLTGWMLFLLSDEQCQRTEGRDGTIPGT